MRQRQPLPSACSGTIIPSNRGNSRHKTIVFVHLNYIPYTIYSFFYYIIYTCIVGRFYIIIFLFFPFFFLASCSYEQMLSVNIVVCTVGIVDTVVLKPRYYFWSKITKPGSDLRYNNRFPFFTSNLCSPSSEEKYRQACM